MTPPDANLEKQKRRHGPVLWGIVGAVVIAGVAWIAYTTYVDIPDEAASGEGVVQMPVDEPATSGSPPAPEMAPDDTATDDTATGTQTDAAPATGIDTETDTDLDTDSDTDSDTDAGAATGD